MSIDSHLIEPRKYLLGHVGSTALSGTDGEVFQYNGQSFELVFDCKIKVLLKDVSRLKEFSLEIINPDEEFLGLYFYPERVELLQNNAEGLSRKRIIQDFFSASDPDPAEPVLPSTKTDTTEEYELLYERLRQQHLANPRTLPTTTVQDPQHQLLLPQLREYQKDAVKFMLHRETVPDSIPASYDLLFANAVTDQDFYLNSYTGELTDTLPHHVLLPTGGILADEMGLGKTVEMLSLILNNPRPTQHGEEESKLTTKTNIRGVNKKSNAQLKCTCASGSTKQLIQCTKCAFYQHVKCVQKNRIESSTETEANYVCPQCWLREPALVETGATIIVSPYSISRQWQSEIRTHISDPSFKVLIYSGVSRFGWISPVDMAQYDVVITDYNVLKSEIHFTGVNEQCLRREKKHLNPSSPLTAIKWWRVCLDEAQMVETPSNQATRMVKTLATVHRWAVTGTPIEKSINQLFGLLFFLDCIPYNELPIWNKLAQPFIAHSNPDPLIFGVLRHVMWRTCKRHVIDQIRIPPQTQRCHRVAMSDIQTVFYRDQHEQCRMVFLEQAARMQRKGLLATSMAKWDSHSIKLLLEPLRKLRQDCTMPSVVGKGEQVAKRLLSPDELYTHLLTVNEIECKSKLRAIASSLNGLAGIAMLLRDYPLAGRYYKSVLKRAAENKEGAVTVDTLLQIHALHNLIRLISYNGVASEMVEEYKEQLRAFEGKYTDNCYQLLKSAANQLESVKPAGDLKQHQKLAHWWRTIIYRHSRTSTGEDQLLKRINLDLRSNNFKTYEHNDFQVASGIDYTLTTWWDTVNEYRSRVYSALDKLKYFTEKIRPGYVATAQEHAQIQALIVAAAECHLILEKDKDKEGANGDDSETEDEPLAKVKRKALCELCQAKITLTEYECKIFDKAFNEDKQEGEGTWKPSWQEWITRTLQSMLRREAGHEEAELVREAEQFNQLIESLKAEYKELGKYWVEINYTAAAYDELNMCKLQLTAVEPETLKKGEKMKRHQISVHEIGLTRSELQAELNEMELGFVTSMRNLSYLKHLSSNPEVQTCPICDLKPEDKYSVWECGHQLCIPCLLAMKKYNGVKLNCPVCRHAQGFKDIHYVTVEKQQSIQVEGKYSSKITRIVQEIQSLRNEDPEVKIIIFSQWDSNLSVINSALLENKISAKSNKSLDMIEHFKDKTGGVTCLLLPLSWGSKGLNLIEATHVFLVEPILNPSEELQAVGRVHRIGQTRPTVVHRFIVENTIEETIYSTVSNDATGKWKCKDITLDNLNELFNLNV